MKRENLVKAILIGNKIKDLERERGYLENTSKGCQCDVRFIGAKYDSTVFVSYINQIDATDDVQKLIGTLLSKFDKKIEELTKEFESL